mgnify:CR=1 FL=1
MSKVLPKNVLSSSQLPPIIVPNLMGLTWGLLGTYLGLTWDLVLGKLCLSMNGSIPNASRTHPEHIPKENIVTASIKIAAEISYAKLC